MKRKQFTFYRSFYEGMMCLPKSSRLEFIQAVIEFALDETYPEFRSDRVKALFLLVEPVLNTGKKRAEAGFAGAIGKHGEIGLSAGKRGGKPGGKRGGKRDGKPGGYIEIEKEIEIETEIEIEGEGEGPAGVPAGESVCGFDDFWNLYPKKIGRPQALEAWKQVVRDPGTVLEALKAWVASDQWKTENGRYVPRADKWLREEHFLEIPRDSADQGFVLGEAELDAIRRLMAEEDD